MNSIFKIFVVLLLILPIIFADVVKVELSDSNFDEKVKTGEWLIVLHSDSCPSCVQFKPELNSFMDKFKTLSKTKLNIGVCDVQKNPATAARFLVMRIPSIYHFKDGELRSLNNHRSAANLTRYFTEKEWTTTPTSMIGPFSFVAQVLIYMVALGSHVIKFMEYVQSNYPPYVVYSGLASLIVLPIVILYWSIRKPRSTVSKKVKDVRMSKKKD